MKTESFTFTVQASGECDVHDLTRTVHTLLKKTGLQNGSLTVFVPGSTAGITTIEFEPGVVEDLKKAVERMAPRAIHYDHDARWGDGNGFAHVRASLLGPSLTVPFRDGDLLTGTWQQIVLVDFDNRPRNREIVVQIMGE